MTQYGGPWGHVEGDKPHSKLWRLLGLVSSVGLLSSTVHLCPQRCVLASWVRQLFLARKCYSSTALVFVKVMGEDAHTVSAVEVATFIHADPKSM